MNLSINHLDKNTDLQFDNTARKRFESHIVKHFDLDRAKVLSALNIGKEGLNNFLTLNFHYKNRHAHFHAQDKNIYKALQHLFKDLERDISKQAMKREKMNRVKLI